MYGADVSSPRFLVGGQSLTLPGPNHEFVEVRGDRRAANAELFALPAYRTVSSYALAKDLPRSSGVQSSDAEGVWHDKGEPHRRAFRLRAQ